MDRPEKDTAACVERVREGLLRLAEVCDRVDGGTAEAARARDLAVQVGAPFLVVVVGEVNSGKSALINQALGEELCAEGPLPVTDRVTVIRGASAAAIDVDGVLEISRELEALEDLCVVDTPGTNSVAREHERITRSFLPRADLVLFVTSADRPFSESERVLLSEIRGEWRRRVLFVVSKVDVREETEISPIVDYVRDCARELLGFEAEVFPVSVRADRREGSNAVGEMWSVVRARLSSRERYRLKVVSGGEGGRKVARDARARVARERGDLEEEAGRMERVDRALGERGRVLRAGTYRFLSRLQEITAELGGRGRLFLDRSFAVARLGLFLREARFRSGFEREVLADVEGDVAALLREASTWIAGELQGLGREVALRLEEMGRKPGEDAGDRVEDTSRALHQMRAEVDEALDSFEAETEAGAILGSLWRGGLGFLSVEASGAAVGTVMVVALNSALLTGIVAGGIVALGGFALLPLVRARAQSRFAGRVEDLGSRMRTALETALGREVDRGLGRLRGVLEPISRGIGERIQERVRLEGELKDVGDLLAAVMSEVVEEDGISGATAAEGVRKAE